MAECARHSCRSSVPNRLCIFMHAPPPRASHRACLVRACFLLDFRSLAGRPTHPRLSFPAARARARSSRLETERQAPDSPTVSYPRVGKTVAQSHAGMELKLENVRLARFDVHGGRSAIAELPERAASSRIKRSPDRGLQRSAVRIGLSRGHIRIGTDGRSGRSVSQYGSLPDEGDLVHERR